MKDMIGEYYKSIDGIVNYSVIVLVLFMIVFIAMLTYVIKLKKSHIDKMSQLPLDD